MIACHQCHSVFPAAQAIPAPLSSTLQYFADENATRRDAKAFTSGPVLAAVEFVVGAVALGMTVGLTEPGPVLRKLGACGTLIGGAAGAAFALVALTRRPLGYVDKSLALTTIAVGVLCVAAAVVIFTGWRM